MVAVIEEKKDQSVTFFLKEMPQLDARGFELRSGTSTFGCLVWGADIDTCLGTCKPFGEGRTDVVAVSARSVVVVAVKPHQEREPLTLGHDALERSGEVGKIGGNRGHRLANWAMRSAKFSII